MNSKNLILGNYYKYKKNKGWWARPIEILKPKTGINTTNKIIVKCEWTLQKNDTMGVFKWFYLSDLEEE